MLLGNGFALDQREDEFLEMQSRLLGVQFEIVETLVVACERRFEFFHEQPHHAVPVLQQNRRSFPVLPVDVGQARKRNFYQLQHSKTRCFITIDSQQSLKDQSLDKRLRIFLMKQLGKLPIISDPKVGMPLIKPKEYPQANLLK